MSDVQRYNDAVREIKTAILRSQYRAAKATNAEQLALYYAIGGYVSSNTREGKWGTGAIEVISERLQKELPGLRGFSATSIKYMRLFYEAWMPEPASPDLSLASDESGEISALAIRHSRVTNLDELTRDAFMSIGFTHHRTILGMSKDPDERLFYIRRCAKEHYSVDTLRRSIKADDYHHQGTLPNNFLETISGSQQALRAVQTFKDEYLLDFINVEELGVRDVADIDERVVEQAIVHNVKNFIMTFGHGFSFVGNQYHLDAFGEDQWIDLLFFNRELNRLVAVELKRGPFKTAYLGQLSGYLSVLDEFERKPHEESSIGIVLCKDMNEAFVNLVIRNFNAPMGVATYTTSADVPSDLRDALPDIDDLRVLLEDGGDAAE
ncbi:MAG: PDDEXK nuclease domain-containing protein [Actinomycetota bacterium]|nr:PDDEXK nuclease domain-containing protein [Actinomycetota bacterium]